MIIVTPSAGSVPEPRPQALITGDRAVTLLADGGISTTALTKAGVQLVTVTLDVYTELTTQLAQVTTDIDAQTGTIKESLLPARLSAGAIAALDLLGSDSHILEQYLPARLSPANLAALMSSSGGTSSSSATITTATIGTANVTTLTVSGSVQVPSAVISGSLEAGPTTLRNQSSTPAAAPSNKTTLYTDANSRPNLINANGQVFLIGNKRIVSSWPAAADSSLGDEAIMSATGEHRIYLGATKGWRLAGSHTVSSIAERNALTNKYVGMTVFVTAGVAQNHVWGADNQWHGTKAFQIQGGPVRSVSGVNDTNFQRWNETPVTDPGYPFYITGLVLMEIVATALKWRSNIWVATVDLANPSQNYHQLVNTYRDTVANSYIVGPMRYDVPVASQPNTPEVGSRLITVDWRMEQNGCGAYSGPYYGWSAYEIHPV